MAHPRILLADDYPDALSVWTMYLEAVGFDVDAAADGREALSRVDAHIPDIVVMDLEMPYLSGFEVAAALRDRDDTHALPMIATTGHSGAGQLRRALEAGFDTVVVKPCDPSELVAEIRRLLAAKGAKAGASAE